MKPQTELSKCTCEQNEACSSCETTEEQMNSLLERIGDLSNAVHDKTIKLLNENLKDLSSDLG